MRKPLRWVPQKCFQLGPALAKAGPDDITVIGVVKGAKKSFSLVNTSQMVSLP